MATPAGSPAAIGVPAVFVATSIGVTTPANELATNTVAPSGVMAMAKGSSPAGMVGPAVFGRQDDPGDVVRQEVGHIGAPTHPE